MKSTFTTQATPITAARGSGGAELVASPVAHGLSVVLAIVTVAAAAPTFFAESILNGPAAMNGSARGTALCMLVLGVPLLVGGQAATRRGVPSGLPLWLGAVAFLLYNAAMLLFATPFNVLFLAYVAMFSVSLWTLVAVLSVVDAEVLDLRMPAPAARRVIAGFCWLIVVLNATAWLRQVIHAMADSAAPGFLDGTGLTTAPGYVQDLAIWLPVTAVGAYGLWLGRRWGQLIAASVLVMWVVESATIAVDQYVGALADPASTVVSATTTPVFLGVAVLLAIPTAVLLRRS